MYGTRARVPDLDIGSVARNSKTPLKAEWHLACPLNKWLGSTPQLSIDESFHHQNFLLAPPTYGCCEGLRTLADVCTPYGLLTHLNIADTHIFDISGDSVSWNTMLGTLYEQQTLALVRF